MDIEETLRRLREWAADGRTDVSETEAMELFGALDGWLTKVERGGHGGFLPADWTPRG